MVGRPLYEKTFTLIPLGDQFEQHTGFSLFLTRVRQVVQDDEIKPIKLRERGWKLQALTRSLEFLDELARACELTSSAVDFEPNYLLISFPLIVRMKL
jgi:hypothetical protein